MLVNKLKLNPSKTEYILVQSKRNIATYGGCCIKVGDADVKPNRNIATYGGCCIKVGDADVKPRASVRNPGVAYSWKKKIPAIIRSMHYVKTVR